MSVLNKALNYSVIISLGLLTSCTSANKAVEPSLDAKVQVDAQKTEAPKLIDSQAKNITRTEPSSSVVLDKILGVRVERQGGVNKYVIDVSKSDPVFDLKKFINPSRFVVDLVGQKIKSNKEISLNDDQFLKAIRFGAHKDKTRIVFDLSNDQNLDTVNHEIAVENGKLVLTLKDDELIANAKIKATEGVVAVVAKPVKAPAPAAVAAESIAITDVKFNKASNDSGEVLLSFSGKAPQYEINQTAPSEFVLKVNASEISRDVKFPQVAPKGLPGIRVVRANREANDVLVRMFVDTGIDLNVKSVDNKIVINTEKSVVAANAQARAQLESADTPQEKVITTKTTTTITEDDESARTNPTGKVRAADGTKDYVGRLISLDLQDTDIDNALRIIAEVSNLNIIASDEVSGKVTLRLIDVPWDQALDVILKTNGLDQVAEGNVIRIAPIDKLRQERESLRESQKAAELLERLSVDYIRVSYARASDLKEQVEAVLSERGTISIDERTNQLIIKDTKQGQEQVRDLLKKLDLRTPQVLLETQIVESGRNILRDLGFQWNMSSRQSPQTGNATGLNFPNSVIVQGANGDNAMSFPAAISENSGFAVSAILDSADGARSLSARLSALESERKVRVISRPQVATVNNKQAEISSVETFRVRTPDGGTAISTGSGASASGGGSNAFEEIKVGIELRVTPQASPDYYVLLDVEAKSSTLGASAPVDNIPSTLDRQATSTILVKSGQTFALGGIYRLDDTDQIEGVPFLKDVPFLGHLFRRVNFDKQDEELIFFITPHIVEGSFDPSLM